MSIDVQECVRKGCVGAAGAIPGTIAAHPMDVVKMASQTTSTGSSAEIARRLFAEGGVTRMYQGLGPALQQKILTRVRTCMHGKRNAR